MMKKIIISLFTLLFVIFQFFPVNVKAKTLRDYYNELSEIEAKMNQTQEQKAATESKIREYSAQILASQEIIAKSQEEITIAQNKIYELNIEIEEKKKEINSLLQFKQIASGDNVYLEYVFGASDFTDFIYRSAIVEQLTQHNDELINEMYDLIEQNKKLTKELEEKIEVEKKATEEFQQMLAANQISLDDLADEERYNSDSIAAKKEEIRYLEENDCGMDEEIAVCVEIPLATGFIRPLTIGEITDEFGIREAHPIYGTRRGHYGIDIGAAWGNNVYAAATGKVAYTIENYTPGSGGGKQVILYHNINGTIYTTVYMHLSSINVTMGEFVTSNTVIAHVGSTGGSTGPHLHFEIHYGESDSSGTAFNPRNMVSFPPLDGWFSSRY